MSQDSSFSPGVQRSRRSPTRHTPYSNRHRPSRNENWNPHGASDDFNNQYPPYNGSSSGGYDRAPFSTTHEHAQRMPALTTVVNVDELSTEYALNPDQRKAAHIFYKVSGDQRAILMYLRVLHTEQQNNKIQEQLQAIQTHLVAVGEFCTQAWKPSKEQTKLLKSLVRHYIIRPITSYTNLVSIVETYIHDHGTQLRLELYKKDPTVKAVVHKLLSDENNAVRSSLRKLVFTSVEDKTNLTSFSKKIIASHHLPTIPTAPPQDIMSCLALMRKVARPLTAKKNAAGGDTGFWKDIERELDGLYEKNGNERNSPEWRESNRWEQKIVDADNRKYSRRAAESNALTQAEIDAAVLLAPDDTSNTGDAGDAGNAGDAGDAGPEGDDENTHEDRAVNISVLGDLAALDTTSVART
ncbi:hypothetical protein B0H11DRAFT_2420702 [Mycena galericulata]|nr:hypothetical protein B0H11DRAFT_2420702 [Mycena galericulata]